MMSIKNVIYCVVLVVTLAPMTVVALPFDLGIKSGVEEFTWREFDESGRQHVEEKGSRTIHSVLIRSKPEPQALRHFIFAAEIKGYYGTTKYHDDRPDNQGDWENDWYGNAIDAEVGLRLGSVPFAWDFIINANYDRWERNMDYDMNEASRDVRTNKQNYAVTSYRLGTGPAWRVHRWYASVVAGIKNSSGTVSAPTDSSYYDEEVKFDLEEEATYFFRFYNYIRITERFSIKVDGYYDAYHFQRTDTKVVNNRNPPNTLSNVTNPESKQINYGIQGGVSISF